MPLTPEQRRERDRAYYAKTKDRRRELNKLRYSTNKEPFQRSNRKGVLKRKYGITPDDYSRMAEEQNHSCFICQEMVDLCVDHCHETGAVRGLLCGPCNRGLGLLKDNKDLLTRAAQYLERGGSNSLHTT